jgi:hypothetical protein
MPVRDLGILLTTKSSSTPTQAAQQLNRLTGFTHAVLPFSLAKFSVSTRQLQQNCELEAFKVALRVAGGPGARVRLALERKRFLQ